ncbi:MAG: sialidase family protein, partial [Chitinophaga rupis]
MRSFFLFTVCLLMLACYSCSDKGKTQETILGSGNAPSLATDQDGHLHLVYNRGDSILYAFSSDKGKSFSAPSLVTVLPGLASINSRGTQIAVSGQGLTVIAAAKGGNIFSFVKNGSGDWKKAGRVNDRDSSAPECLAALGGDGNNLYATWIDLRDGYNRIYGAASSDGGESWSKNVLIYASPDSMICPCCRPSVAVKGNQVFVMFRNLVNGCRDLYFTRSTDAGRKFDASVKLGNGSWKLNGCPMDGGGLMIDENGTLQTVWRRRDTIYTCEPG